MARARYREVVQFPDPATGLIHKVSTAQVTVYEPDTTTLIGETLYQDKTGSASFTNPFTITDGVIQFYLDTEQTIDIKIDATGSGYGVVTHQDEYVQPVPELLRTSIRSLDGTYVMQYDGDGILTAPGLLSKYGGWDLEVDGGLTPGSAAAAANNATLFGLLRDKIAGYRGGDIKVNNSFFINPISLTHGNAFSTPINLIGVPGRATLQFVGPAGPFLDIGNSSQNSQMHRVAIQDLMITHKDAVTSGATIRIGTKVFDYTLEGVKILSRGRPDEAQVEPCEAALIGIEAYTGFTARYCKIELRNDEDHLGTGNLFPTGVLMVNSGDIGGLFFYFTGIDGCPNRSQAFYFRNAGFIDTPRFVSCLFKDHEYGIRGALGAGSVGNLDSVNLILDALTGKGLFLEPNGGSYFTWNFVNTWIAAYDHNIELSDSNGGELQNINFTGGYFTNALLSPVMIRGNNTGKVYNNSLTNVTVLSSCNVPTEAGLNLGGTLGAYARAFRMNNCVMQVGPSSYGAVFSPTGAQGVKIDNNLFVGKNGSPNYTLDADSSFDNNSYLASLV